MNELTYRIATSEAELEGAFLVRRRVFVAEQKIAEDEEFDGLDGEALHVIAMEGREVIGTARARFLGGGRAKVERMAVAEPCRRMGVGTGMLSFLLGELKMRQVSEVSLNAQYHVAAFYRACGFMETGAPFLEVGIKHIRMQRTL